MLARRVTPPAELERRNANLVGGDINGGAQDLRRTARGLFLRRSCGHFDHADMVGATNIAAAAKVARREVAEQRLTAAAYYSDKLHLQRVSV